MTSQPVPAAGSARDEGAAERLEAGILYPDPVNLRVVLRVTGTDVSRAESAGRSNITEPFGPYNARYTGDHCSICR
jgi:hypothetical protein